MRALLSFLWFALASAWVLAFQHLSTMIGGYKYLSHMGLTHAAAWNLLMAGLCVIFALLFLLRHEKWIGGFVLLFAFGASLHLISSAMNVIVLARNGHLSMLLVPFFNAVALAYAKFGSLNSGFVGMPAGKISLLLLPTISLFLLLVTSAYAKKAFVVLGAGIVVPLLAFCATGVTLGIPQWERAAEYEAETERYFQEACRTKARVELPRQPVLTTGVAILDPSVARQSFLTSNDSYEYWIDPGNGKFHQVEIQMAGSDGFFSIAFDAQSSSPNEVRTTRGTRIPAPTQTIAIRSMPVSTPQELDRGIEGVETVITNLQTNETIARRIVYARYIDKNNKWEKFRAVCPNNSIDEQSCSLNGCSVLPFLLSATRPMPPDETTKLFHLYKGVGRYKGISCASRISIGPEIDPEDIEWWAFGDRGINLRVRGTIDHVYCENFGFGDIDPELKFANGRSARLRLKSFPEDQRGIEEKPRRLIDTMEKR